MPKNSPLDSDLDAIRALAGVLDETGLTEVELERGDVRIRISRGGGSAMVAAAAPAPALAPAAAAQAPVAAPVASDPGAHPGAVTSPMVGTAYMASQPGAAPFVTEGATVAAGQTLLIVEAMKTMNEIKAPKAGRVSKIIVEDASPVEFGEVLMIVE